MTKPFCYMTKEELNEVREVYLKGYLIESLGYDEDSISDYTKDDLISVIIEDNQNQRKLEENQNAN